LRNLKKLPKLPLKFDYNFNLERVETEPSGDDESRIGMLEHFQPASPLFYAIVLVAVQLIPYHYRNNFEVGNGADENALRLPATA